MDIVGDYWAANEASEAVITMTELNDPGQPYSCTQWGNQYANVHETSGGGQSFLNNGQGFEHHDPLIVSGPNYGMFEMFNTGNASPSNVWIDHTMTVYYKTNNTGYYLANLKIEQMLEACGDLCAGCSGTIDSDGDGIDDECDDCDNLLGDINDDQTHDILDIVNVVNIILNGGFDSDDYTECEKSDADMDGNEVVNILDVIQLINLILDNRIAVSNETGHASINYSMVKDELHININADKGFSGVQLNIAGDYTNIELVNNSHIQLFSQSHHEVTRVVAYSLLNDTFDSQNATFIVKGVSKFDIHNVGVIVSDQNGVALVTSQAVNSQLIQNGPNKFELNSVYPNPFNPSTEITFSVPSDGFLRLSVFNIQGQEVDVIHEGFQSAGVHAYSWDAADMSSGVYYIRLVSGAKSSTMKAMLLK